MIQCEEDSAITTSIPLFENMSSYYTGIKGIDSKLHLFNVRGGSRRVSCVSYENLLKYLVSLELSMGHTISYRFR